MKMRKSEHFVRSSSSIAGQTFSVKMTDKLFETLFSSLYRYKEAASLRETICNALDSHGMRDRLQKIMPSYYASLTPPPQLFSKYLAPKGTPVNVHLPDDYEPWLEIKDWGIGLPLEKIIGEPILAREDEVLVEGNLVVKEDEIPDSTAVIGIPGFYEGQLVFRSEDGEIIRSPGLYTTLFNSTKEDDDGQIGAFGLGSKSPFAVSDSFTVESRYEGKLYRFLMYLNANRIPSVDLITKDLDTRDPLPEDTEEFNGLTIKIPVKNHRFRSFQDELVRLGKTMRPEQRPIVENHDYYFSWENINFDDRVGDTYIQPKGQGTTHYAVMGTVPYPVDLKQLDPEVSSVMDKFPSSYTFFNLGDLNVPPSREDLSYDEFTRESLNSKYKDVANKIMAMRLEDLRMAAALGPLALYIKKTELSEAYGSGFRKMMERDFPVDPRFQKDSFHYNSTPDLERDYNIDPPFHRLNRPFDTEIYEGTSVERGFGVYNIMRWKRESKRIAVVIDNSNRARNLKIQTARKNYDVVVVVTPASDYLQCRNLLANNKEAFLNHEAIEAHLKSWVGTQDLTTDYLAFADKFVDVVADIFSPDEVLFMHEMKYETPPVTKDSGLYPFEDNYFRLDSYRELKGPYVSEIIESGQKIVYIEVSGNECIHQIHGNSLKESAAEKLVMALRAAKMGENEVGDNINIFEFMGYHPTVMLARRKSLPMMKKFPEVFVPIDVLFDMLLQHFKPSYEIVRAGGIVADLPKINADKHRLRYGAKLLAEALGEVPCKYMNKLNHFFLIEGKSKDCFTDKEWKRLRSLSEMKPSQEGFAKFRKFLDALNYTETLNQNVIQYNKQCEKLTSILQTANRIIMGYGFMSIDQTRTITKEEKRRNRICIESHRMVKFIKEYYVPTAHNAIEDGKELLEVISNRILEG